jgi:hypothetical protein
MTHIPSIFSNRLSKALLGSFLAVVLISCLHFGSAAALSGSSFQAGHIIDNDIFTNSTAMTVQQIQNFLNAKVGGCDTNGTQSSNHWNSGAGRYYTHAEWGALNGNPAPFTCINQYIENTSSLQNNIGNPSANIAGGISAAQIIYNAAQQYQINPEVILTTLQKEQGLVTDNWPWAGEFHFAMGYSCPDTSGCSSNYSDFFKQIDGASWQYRYYLTHAGAFNFWTGQNYIQYNPNTACGGSVVNIQNSATAALYIYTPYQPNQAALNNLTGTGDGCSAYGNRNFWYTFNTWFGPSLDVNNFCPQISDGIPALNGCPDVIVADVNGDGKTDLLHIWSGGVNTWISNGDGTYNVHTPFLPFPGYNMNAGITWLTGDFTGDGKTDLAHVWSGGVNLWISNGDGTYNVHSPYLPSAGYDMTQGIQWLTGDFNGDGKTDIAELTTNGVVLWISNGDGTFTVKPAFLPFSGYNMTGGIQWLVGDFNGDGKTDLAHVWGGGINTWTSNGDGTFAVSNPYLPFPGYNMSGGFYWKVGDSNSDGKADILHMWSGGVNTWLSNGNGTYSVTNPYTPFPGYNMTGGTWQFADVNGDGKMDLLHMWSGGVNTWLSNGNGTYTVHNPSLPFPGYNMTGGYQFLAGNYTSATKAGLVHIWAKGLNTWTSNGDGTYTTSNPYVPFTGYYTAGGTWY